MNETKAKKRIAKLRELINHYRYQYHVLDKSVVSDAVNDSLKHELFKLEEQYPDLVTPDSPTQRVSGKPLPAFKKVKHQYPVLSLEDVFSFEELEEYQAKIQKFVPGQQINYFGELKLDGLTVVLTYKKGVLVQGATRGDGRTGEDVTLNVKTIESIPLALRQPEKVFGPKNADLVVRGEVIMTKKAFARLNREQEKKREPTFANPRNVTAGSVRQLDPKITAARELNFIAYEVLNDIGQKSHEEVHAILHKCGFKTDRHDQPLADLKAAENFIKKWESRRKALPYQTDGLVIVVDNINQQKKMGTVGKAQRWMVAYKFPAEQATTVIKKIKVQIGRQGTLTPVAVFEPVRVAGSTVSRATLHNADEIKRLDVRVGDTVVIQKAGDVIPDVVKVIKKLRPASTRTFRMPTRCPLCGGKVTRKKGEVAHYCANEKCYAVSRRALQHFVSKKGFDIEGLGPKILDQLYENNLIESPADIFDLTRGDLEPLERFAEKSAANLTEAIEASKNITLSRFINALGIRMIGEETAGDIARSVKLKRGRVSDFANIIKKRKVSDFDSMEGIGEKAGRHIYDYFHDPRNLKFLDRLGKAGVKIKNPALAGAKLAGQKFVLTGSLRSLSRTEAKDKIKALGGQVSSAVSKNTDYVVAGENPGSKFKKAQELKVRIISEQKFLGLIGSK